MAKVVFSSPVVKMLDPPSVKQIVFSPRIVETEGDRFTIQPGVCGLPRELPFSFSYGMARSVCDDMFAAFRDRGFRGVVDCVRELCELD